MKRDMTFGGLVGPGLEMDEATYRRIRKERRATPPVSFGGLLLALMVVSAMFPLNLVLPPLLMRLGVAYRFVDQVAGALSAAPLAVVLWLICRGYRRRRVRRTLRECGFAVCERCGYVMTGLATDAPCPECGRVSATPVVDR